MTRRLKERLENSPYKDGHYTRTEMKSNKDVKWIHQQLLARLGRPGVCSVCGKENEEGSFANVWHHVNEENDAPNYGVMIPGETVVSLCRKCHAKVHLPKYETPKGPRPESCQRIQCYETGKVYRGIREVDEAGFNGNKVWCCCNDNRKKVTSGRKTSGGLHWLFEGDEPNFALWNKVVDYSWKHRNGYIAGTIKKGIKYGKRKCKELKSNESE
jgi:hypothetical protein